MNENNINNTIEATVRAVLAPYANIIEPQHVEDSVAVLFGKKLAVEKSIPNDEPPMKIEEAAKLLRCTKSNIHFHVRQGRIRRVKVPGATRACGLVAADVRAIAAGEVA